MCDDTTETPALPIRVCQDQWIPDPLTFGPPPGHSATPPLLAHLNYFPDELVGRAATTLLQPRQPAQATGAGLTSPETQASGPG